jgi:uncharacterized protein YkwD
MRFTSALIFAIVVSGATVAADDKPAFKLTADEQKTLELTNKERAAEKLPPLKVNETLTLVARAHSANMAKQGKMEHVLDGKKCGDRVLGAGYDYLLVKENIAAGTEWSVDTVMKEWMASKGHRANILNDEVVEIGIGIVADPGGKLYYTQVFGKLMAK